MFAGKNRPDMGKGCPERLTWEFLRYILTYRTTRRPRIRQLLAQVDDGTRVVILADKVGFDDFLATLPLMISADDSRGS